MTTYNNDTTRITNQEVTPATGSLVATNPLSEDRFWLTQQVPALSPTSASTPTQTTTLPSVSGQSYVSDVSVSAYMRAVNIDFVCYNMRPNRRVYVYFDGKDVSKLVQKTNVIKIDNNTDFVGLVPRIVRNTSNINSSGTIVGPVDTTQETVTIGGAQSKVFYTKEDADGNTIVCVSEFIQPNTNIDWANTTVRLTRNRTGQIANVVTSQHFTGYIRKAAKYTEYANGLPIVRATDGNRYYKLDLPSTLSENDIVGKTITLVTGANPGQTAEILGYNRANGEVYLSRDFSNFISLANTIYSIGNVDPSEIAEFTTTENDEQIFYDPGKPDNYAITGKNSGFLYTDENGILAGTIRIPDPNLVPEYRFRVGEKLIRICDSPVNNPEDATTIAEFIFVAFGLNLSRSQIVINGAANQPNFTAPSFINPNLDFAAGVPDSPIIPIDPNQVPLKVESYSPLAQSFFVSPVEYPRGFYTPYVDLFFANKGTLPIEVQIRPMKNGFPDTSQVLPNAVAYLDARDVNVTSNPDANDPNSYTRFTFVSPVYLQPEQEYALVVKTNDFDYDIYVSELGQTILNTNRLVSQQPYTGILFKSQNSSTYSPIQDEDLMFVIHKCQFEKAGTVFFNEFKDPTYSAPLHSASFTSNSYVDGFIVHSDTVELPGTSINYSYRTTSNSTRLLDGSYTNFKPERVSLVPERKVIYGPNYASTSFEMRLDISTSSPDVSPIIYKNKQSVAAMQTVINNMGLDTYRVTVANTGNGYTTQNTSVTFTSNTGQGANAFVITKIEPTFSGKVYTLAFDSNGYGYYDDVNVSISSADANASGAVINILSETGKAGGPAQARYISKTVTLAPEFEAGDLRVYLTAVRPREADVQVYYKVKNAFDNENISNKKWVRMVKVPGTFEYSAGLEPLEMEFRPALNSNTIVYSTNTATFDTFSQFKIKIVMASSDTVLEKIPYVYDMRAIALPGDV